LKITIDTTFFYDETISRKVVDISLDYFLSIFS